jgi:hypothetical protein
MFEFSKDEQISGSLKSVPEKISSHEDEFDGKFLFFDKEGKFLGESSRRICRINCWWRGISV